MDLNFKTGEELFQFLLIIVLLLFTLVLLFVVMNIFMVLKRINNRVDGVEIADARPRSWWSSLTGAVPIEKENTVMLDHNYDGIRELDNHLPPWWLGLFWGCIVFGVLYLANYHIWKWSPNQEEEYQQEVAAAQKQIEEFQAKNAAKIDETNVTLVNDEGALAKGKATYDAKCLACHGAAGEGGVGPNLTDVYWLHGGDIKSVFKTIKEGVPSKGMIAWKSQLKADEMQNVASYILTKMQGTNPPNAKAPQGEKYEPAAAPGAAAPADTAAKAVAAKM